MYCRKCGNSLDATANFCNRCGTVVLKHLNNKAQQTIIEYDDYEADETINKGKNIIAITLVFSVLAISFITIIAISVFTKNII